MTRLSIVIPVLGDLKRLEDTLVSVLENRPDDCQIVVVPNQPYDDPYDLKGEVCFIQAPAGAGLVPSANLGISASRAPIVHLLSCVVEVDPGWADAALAHFEDPQIAAVAPLVLDRDDPHRVVVAGVGYRPAGVVWKLGRGMSPADANRWQDALCGPDTLAAFYRKAALESVGRFADGLGDRLAGVDLALALQQVGFRCTLEPRCRAYAEWATASQQSRLSQGREAERLFWRWAPQAGWSRSLASHTLLLGAECLQAFIRPTTVVRVAGRLLGGLQAASDRHHGRRIPELPLSAPKCLGAPHFSATPGGRKRLQSARTR